MHKQIHDHNHQQTKNQHNKIKAESQILLNLFGEKDSSILIYNRIGVIIIILASLSLFIYSCLKFINMQSGTYDTFVSVLASQQLDETNHLYRNSNFMVFFAFEFGSPELVRQLGIIKNNNIDLERLAKFVTFDLKLLKKKADGNSYMVRAKHRNCRQQDFTERGYNSKLPQQFEHYICLEIEKVQDHYALKNYYFQRHNRDFESVYFEINKCHENCESDHNIDRFIQTSWVYAMNLDEQLSFRNKYNQVQSERLTILSTQILNTVQLKRGRYTYQIGKLRKNIVNIPKSRYNLFINSFISQDQYIFYSVHPQIHTMQADGYYESQLITEDGHSFYKLENIEVLYGLYFHLSNDIYVHDINQFTMMDLLSQIGGLLGILIGTLLSLVKFLNYPLILEQLYEYQVYQRQKNSEEYYKMVRDNPTFYQKHQQQSSSIDSLHIDDQQYHSKQKDSSRSQKMNIRRSYFKQWSCVQQKNQISFGLFDRYFPIQLYRMCKGFLNKLKLGQN